MLGAWMARLVPGNTELRERSIAVLGADTEPGTSIALALAGSGVRLALIENNPGEHRGLLEKAKRSGGSGIAASSLVEASEVLRGLDVVVFTTGNQEVVSLRKLEAEHFEALLREQAVAALAHVQEAVQVLEAKGRGTIVAVAEGPGFSREAGLGAHAAAQAATLRTLEALRTEVAASGIQLSTVVPSGLVGWHPSPGQIAEGVLAVLRLGLKGLSIPPGAQALEAMATLAPEPIGNMLAWFSGTNAAPPPPSPPPATKTQAAAKDAEGSQPLVDLRPSEPSSNSAAVRAAAARAADLMKEL